MFVIPAPNSVAFSIFGIPIYKYGIVMALAIFVAMVLANYYYNISNSEEKSFRKDIIYEYAPLIIVAGILGARIYFCMLNPHYYLTHMLEILDIRQGGLSIHGAILGGGFGLWLVAKRTKTAFLAVIDTLSGSMFAGQAIGRWGNYFNSEAFGLPVAGQNWGLFIPEASRPVQYSEFSLFHPAFLYESCLDILGFAIMYVIVRRFGKTHKGMTFFTYLILYSLIRFFVEQIRVDSALNIGIVPVAQIVSVIMFVAGLCGVVYVLRKNRAH
jgi:phosphatidylglycerol:prolipoprotein diacylglycerol transferase